MSSNVLCFRTVVPVLLDQCRENKNNNKPSFLLCFQCVINIRIFSDSQVHLFLTLLGYQKRDLQIPKNESAAKGVSFPANSEGLPQAFLFDLFSASRPSLFAETLSFLLELLNFPPFSFEVMFENFKNSIFLL